MIRKLFSVFTFTRKFWLFIIVTFFPAYMCLTTITLITSKPMPTSGLDYFEHKGWYYGNETLICKRMIDIKRFENAAMFGYMYHGLEDMEIRKCRGKWYSSKWDKKVLSKCIDSVSHFDANYCSYSDPFCVDPENGKGMWNTHYDPKNPKRLIDPRYPIPNTNFTTEEVRHIRNMQQTFPYSWKGYKETERYNVYIDPEDVIGGR